MNNDEMRAKLIAHLIAERADERNAVVPDGANGQRALLRARPCLHAIS